MGVITVVCLLVGTLGVQRRDSRPGRILLYLVLFLLPFIGIAQGDLVGVEALRASGEIVDDMSLGAIQEMFVLFLASPICLLAAFIVVRGKSFATLSPGWVLSRSLISFILAVALGWMAAGNVPSN